MRIWSGAENLFIKFQLIKIVKWVRNLIRIRRALFHAPYTYYESRLILYMIIYKCALQNRADIKTNLSDKMKKDEISQNMEHDNMYYKYNSTHM